MPIEKPVNYPARLARVALGILAAACAPAAPPPAPPPAPPAPAVGLPPVPPVEGPLRLRVVHPTPATPRPRVDSTFVYGSAGTGAAEVSINGFPVEVHPNGAFLAYLPLPADGRWEIVARAGAERASTSVAYRTPPAAAVAPAAPVTEEFTPARSGVVIGGADTLATGSDAVPARPTPTGPYRWFLPRGTELSVTARRGEMLRVRLAAGAEAWLNASAVRLGAPAAPEPRAAGEVVVREHGEAVELRVPAGRVPFLVEPGADRLSLTLYGVTPPAGGVGSPAGDGDSLLESLSWSVPAADVARLELRLAQRLWGYTATYDADGSLVLRLRRPPLVDRANPLRGLRIVVDPGHPPGGATGPTGLTEAEANLNIALPLAERLRAAGAEVYLTRTADIPVSLIERVNLAIAVDAHLLVSVHNNAFAEGANPFRRHGTSTYYFHSHSEALARSLQREIQAATAIPDLGALTGNLALVRPTWMPAVLTESLFMPLPQQEAALRDPDFVRRLAEAHVRGIEAFLRGP